MSSRFVPLVICLAFVPVVLPHTISSPKVELKRVPNRGIQPQVAMDENGTVHLVYFTGDPSQGDLFYAQSKDGEHFPIPSALIRFWVRPSQLVTFAARVLPSVDMEMYMSSGTPLRN
jgi:hypothetical protein